MLAVSGEKADAHQSPGDMIDTFYFAAFDNLLDLHFRLRLMFDVVPMPMDWPAEVVYHEAKAFCRWKGEEYRLPTEAEYHVIRGLPSFDSEHPEETDPVCSKSSRESHNFALYYGSSTVHSYHLSLIRIVN